MIRVFVSHRHPNNVFPSQASKQMTPTIAAPTRIRPKRIPPAAKIVGPKTTKIPIIMAITTIHANIAIKHSLIKMSI